MAYIGRVYGRWAGNPNGTQENKEHCIVEVYSGVWQSSQCARKRGFGPEGLYCRQHDPEYVKKKEAERDAKYKEERKKENLKFARLRIADEALMVCTLVMNGETKSAKKLARTVLQRFDEYMKGG